MKTIKIFFASSEELEDDRNAFGNLVRRLNKIYQKRGIELELFEWEDYDAAYNNRRKQDEYNDNVRACDIFLAVFHRVAGRFTIEEFDIATEEFRKKSLPKTYVYCKDIKEGENESSELKEFKQRLIDEMGHYWSRYSNRDTMQLHFVMQLQMIDGMSQNDLKVENGAVMLQDQVVSRMENLPFASHNEDYQKMSARLAELPAQIANFRMLNEQMPGQEFIQTQLQTLLNEYNQLQDDFAKYQQNLFDTAKRIAQLQGERVTERMRRAMEAFNEGKVREANIILEEAERDARMALTEYRQSKELTEQKRQNVAQSIDELLLKSSTVLSDYSIPVEERIAKAEDIYAEADAMAKEIDLEPEKYDKLLFDYGKFLRKYGKYEKAKDIIYRDIELREALYGVEHSETATLYNNIGVIYTHLAVYDKALEYYLKALEIRKKVLGEEHSDTATSYNNIGRVYSDLGDYDRALEYYLKALKIKEKVLGEEHPDTATSYNNIGAVYFYLGDYDRALEYYDKALEIYEKVLGKEHPDTAPSYNNIGGVYSHLGDYNKALEYRIKALEIRKKVLGEEHPDTAISYNSIGRDYTVIGDYNRALEYYLKALEIFKKVLGDEHPNTAPLYNNIGKIYSDLADCDKALHYLFKAIKIRKAVVGEEHPGIAVSYHHIGEVYSRLLDFDKSLEYYTKALNIRKKVLGEEHPKTQATIKAIEELRAKINV
ncbi:MAG: tetratricopeptide repeat protein [Alistipes sp.]|nr:tetratricopeptide repeat protein [Alistipes sp.]MBR5595036.1 tetratricopeptide repeat protein [Alistipes sp.]